MKKYNWRISNKKLTLYTNCKIVRGISQSIICDLLNQSYNIIPNDLSELINDYKDESFKLIYIKFTGNENVLDEYFDFLQSLNALNLEDEKSGFIELSTNFYSSTIITNAILDNNFNSSHDYLKIVAKLNELGCEDVQLRFFDNISKDNLHQILCSFDNSTVLNIDLIVKYSDYFISNYNEVIDKFPRINRLLIHSSNKDKIIHKGTLVNVITIKQEIKSSSHCGFISEVYFDFDTKKFMENLNFNSCLNNKISIDIDGNIKNCPAMKNSYGKIESDNIVEISKSKKFQKFWSIKKDEIEKCKECEFRYICMDCRAFLEDPSNVKSKPLKCGYNPETTEWEDWSKSPLKQKAIKFYSSEKEKKST